MQKRILPHIYPDEAAFFITFRLHGSLPYEVIQKIQEEYEINVIEINKMQITTQEKKELIYNNEKRFFGKYDAALESYMTKDDFLNVNEVASIVADKIHQYDQIFYDLKAFCIMPNHVHILFDTAGYPKKSISKIMQLIKGGSSRLCNEFLNRKGEFWQTESYDHYVRSKQEFLNIASYIVQNPVKARLIDDWEKWRFTYLST